MITAGSFEFPVFTNEFLAIETGKDADIVGNLLILLDFIQRILRIWLNSSMGDIRMRQLSAAMTNTVFIIKNEHSCIDPSEPNQILLRIYGNGVDSILDRENELDWFAKLSKAGAGPKLLATFQNGRFEEYINSITFTPKMMCLPELSLAMAKFHTLSVEGDVIIWNRIKSWRKEANSAFALLLETHQHNSNLLPILLQIGSHKIFDEEEFREGGKFARFFEYLLGLENPIVPCHNDLQHGNILQDKRNNSVILIDYEYSGMNYAAYDIANHFCEWASDFTTANPNPHIMDFEGKYPDLDERRAFIETYLEHTGFDVSVDEWIEAVEGFKEISHLLWAYWGVIQAKNSKIDFDYLGYALMRLEAMSVPGDRS